MIAADWQPVVDALSLFLYLGSGVLVVLFIMLVLGGRP